MTAYAPRHTGPQRAARPSIFRRLAAAWRGEPAAPEVPLTASGAGATEAVATARAIEHASAMHAINVPYLPKPPRHAASTMPRRKPLVNRQPWQTAQMPVVRARQGVWE